MSLSSDETFFKILSLLFVGSVIAAGDSKESAKAKRAYSLGYGYAPYTSYYDHDLIAHAPVAAVSAVHAPVTAAVSSVSTVHHAPVAHAPYVAPYTAPFAAAVAYKAPIAAAYHAPFATAAYAAPVAAYHAPVVAHAPLAKVTSSVYSSNIHHYPSSYVAPAAAYYSAPAAVATYAHSPLLTEFHRR